jgi:hypothetical protein
MRHLRRPGDRLVEVVGIANVVPAALLCRLSARIVGAAGLAVAEPDRRAVILGLGAGGGMACCVLTKAGIDIVTIGPVRL